MADAKFEIGGDEYTLQSVELPLQASYLLLDASGASLHSWNDVGSQGFIQAVANAAEWITDREDPLDEVAPTN